MNTVKLDKCEFKSLEDLSNKSSIYYAESLSLRIIERNGKKYLLKEIDTDDKRLANKLYVTDSLDKYRNYIPSNLILPTFYVDIEDNSKIIAMDYIKGTNLSKILDNPLISINDKMLYLKKIGILLNKMKETRDKTPLKEFYLGDMHEDNFIVNTCNKDVYAVDLDSAKIMNSENPISKYLNPSALLNNSDKYKYDDSNPYIVNYKVDYNTDIYCYIIMILRYLYGHDVNTTSLEEFNRYLNYLDDIKVNPHLLDCFNSIVTDSDNKNPVEYLDSLSIGQICYARKRFKKNK